MKSHSPMKAWTRMGITRGEYLSGKPWKECGMSREKFEKLILSLPQEVVADSKLKTELRDYISGEAKEK
ncbi:MAG TPA: hypothetical protein PKV75_07525 [Desulfobacterales bacterium]|nr:hypothetical protein [Desulfobacterales bacterium]